MKQTYFVLALAAMCSLQEANAQRTVQKADLSEVTVYTNGATMTHAARIRLPAGSSELVLTHVSSEIDPNSIQIGAGPDVTILSVRPATHYVETDIKTEAYQAAERSLQEAVQTLTSLQNEKATDESVLALLEKNQQIGGENGLTTVTELAKMLEYYKPRYLAVKNNLSALEEKISEQEGIVLKARIQFDQVRSQSSGFGGQIVAQVIASQEGSYPLSVSYLTRKAQWRASYDLRAENTNSPLQIEYKGQVTQTTGVDWQQVNLRLSTGNPTLHGTAPRLEPWFLHFTTPRLQGVQLNEISLRRGEVAVQSDQIASKSANEYVLLAENQLNTTFDIRLPASIASNGLAHAVSLQEYQHPAEYHYYVAPARDRQVYLQAELSDYESLNLVPGQANVFLEHTMVGSTFLNPQTANDTLKLTLGRDPMIAVDRRLVQDHSSNRVFGSSRTQTRMFEITIKNNKKSPIKLVMQEQYPISGDRQIEVNLLESSGAQVDGETGIVTWTLEIPAGDVQTQRFGYSVRYPKDQQVSL